MEAYIRKTFDNYMCPKEQAKFQSQVTKPITTRWNQHTAGTSLRDHKTPNTKKNWALWWRNLIYNVYKFSFYSLVTLVNAWHVYSFTCYLIHYRRRVHFPTGEEEKRRKRSKTLSKGERSSTTRTLPEMTIRHPVLQTTRGGEIKEASSIEILQLSPCR